MATEWRLEGILFLQIDVPPTNKLDGRRIPRCSLPLAIPVRERLRLPFGQLVLAVQRIRLGSLRHHLQ